MNMPKIMKKHRTFDCDLNGLETRNALNAPNDFRIQTTTTTKSTSNNNQPLTSKPANNNNNDNSTRDDNNNANQTGTGNDANRNAPVECCSSSYATRLNNQKRDAKLDTVHVIVGNESCDLDSAVSCLLMFHIVSKMSDGLNGKDQSRTLYIPLLNTTRDLLDTRTEVLWFLDKTLNIDKSFLTCRDDIDWPEIKRNGVEVLVTLVDHNYNEEFNSIGRIVEIIDHHQIQNKDWFMANVANMRVTLDPSVGSCTTLVAERLFYIYAEHHISNDILTLIYGTIILDTVCLSEKAKRYTRRDVYLLKKLDTLLSDKKPVRDELYKQLVEVKNCTKDLNFERLMKRDLKLYKYRNEKRVGIASLFGMAAKEALGLAANIDLDQFFRQNQYEAFLVMGLIADLHQSDSISRDLVLISQNKSLFERLCKALEQETTKLDLVPINADINPDPEDTKNTTYSARIWIQRNVSSSRKVVAPLVLKVLHDEH